MPEGKAAFPPLGREEDFGESVCNEKRGGQATGINIKTPIKYRKKTAPGGGAVTARIFVAYRSRD